MKAFATHAWGGLRHSGPTPPPTHPSGFALALAAELRSCRRCRHLGPRPTRPAPRGLRPRPGALPIAGGFGEAERSEGAAGRVAGAECGANPPRVPMSCAWGGLRHSGPTPPPTHPSGFALALAAELRSCRRCRHLGPRPTRPAPRGLRPRPGALPIAGGFGEAERSERAAGRVAGAECEANPPKVPMSCAWGGLRHSGPTPPPTHPSGFALALAAELRSCRRCRHLGPRPTRPAPRGLRLRPGALPIAGGFGEAERSEGAAGRVAGAECEANPPRVPMSCAWGGLRHSGPTPTPTHPSGFALALAAELRSCRRCRHLGPRPTRPAPRGLRPRPGALPIAGGFGEAERSERAAGRVAGAECEANPPKVPMSCAWGGLRHSGPTPPPTHPSGFALALAAELRSCRRCRHLGPHPTHPAPRGLRPRPGALPIAGGFGEAERSEGAAGRVAGAECEANPPKVPMSCAWGAAELRSARTIAGGFGEAERSEGAAGRVAGAECEANPPKVPMSCAWGAAELRSARTIAGGFGNPPKVPMSCAWGAAELRSARTIAGGFGNPPKVPMSCAWGAAELRSARTIAGGFGNPPRVPI